MATNQYQENGRHLRVAPTSGAALSGDPGLFGILPGVAELDQDDDNMTTMDFGGVYLLAVKGEDKNGNTAVTAGDILYWDTDTLNKNVTDGVRFGYALLDVGSGATTTIPVKIGY